jgi:hypothetical protein
MKVTETYTDEEGVINERSVELPDELVTAIEKDQQDPQKLVARINPGSVINGLLYCLSKRGYESIYVRTSKFNDALNEAFITLIDIAPRYNLRPSFAIAPDEFGESAIALNAITAATLRGVAIFTGFSNEYLILNNTIRVVRLSDLPGPPEVYEEIASAFITKYTEKSSPS